MDESDILDLLKLQRLTREFLDHLMAMFPVEEAAGLLRAMADTIEQGSAEIATRDAAPSKIAN